MTRMSRIKRPTRLDFRDGDPHPISATHGGAISISKVSDAGLVHLKELSKLKDLSLAVTKVTDAGLVRLKGLTNLQKLDLYNSDMQQMFQEVARVLKPGAQAAFVVGDATVDGSEVTTTSTMAHWAVAAGLSHERTLPKTVFGLYNVMSDEKILIFRRPD